jgi:hypothetical protein
MRRTQAFAIPPPSIRGERLPPRWPWRWRRLQHRRGRRPDHLAPAVAVRAKLPRFGKALELLRASDVTYGNLETTIFDPRTFAGAPYSSGGDWTNSAVPAAAGDLRAMGFTMVGRANNHALDWGLEGMRETGRWLDEAGIAWAGVGESHGLARAPAYVETAKGRIALVSLASTFRSTSESLPAAGATPGRAGLSALHLDERVAVPARVMELLEQARCALQPDSCKAGERRRGFLRPPTGRQIDSPTSTRWIPWISPRCCARCAVRSRTPISSSSRSTRTSARKGATHMAHRAAPRISEAAGARVDRCGCRSVRHHR